MRPFLSALLILLAIPLPVLGQVVEWDIAKRHIPSGLSLRRRAGTVIDNDVSRGGYFAKVKIGTPGQEVSLQIDTGSSDAWVPFQGASVCRDSSTDGCSLGSFNPNDSSSYDLVGSGLFNIRYVDDSYAKGDYFTDDFQIGNVSLQNFTIGLGVDTTMPYGLIGVGYINSEAITQMAPVEYPNLPQALQKGGFIRSVAYSLWLNSLNSSDGSILFGAINTANYQGDLVRIPVLPNQSSKNYTQFSVSIYSLEAESPSGSDRLTTRQFPLAAVLDSGTTLTYLPQDLVESIWQEVGALYDDSVQAAILPCSSSNRPGHFSFLFAGPDGPRINVTMAELVLNVTSGRRPRFDSGPYRGQAACQFGIQNTTQNTYILGDTFLRSAYVVYDLENNEIGLAPANYDAQQANIVAFASKGAPIPSSKAMSVSGSGSGSPPLATQTGFSARDGFQPDSAASATIPSRALQWILALVLPLASELVLTY